LVGVSFGSFCGSVDGAPVAELTGGVVVVGGCGRLIGCPQFVTLSLLSVGVDKEDVVEIF